jgi:hypothetical protein
MHERDHNDDLVFDRLVDGELAPTERRELLASLDDRPDGWRRCALAFLEAQSWTDELGQFVRESSDADRVILERTPAGGVPATKRGIAWLAIAASLLIAFTLGTLSRERGAPIAGNSNAASPSQIATVAPPQVSATPDDSKVDDTLTLWVRDESGQTRPLHVPLVDAGALDEQLGLQFQSGVPESLRSRLHERGLDVQTKRRYAPLWFENGRPMFVPVEDTRIVPVSQNVY